jgi:hypothetical protein
LQHLLSVVGVVGDDDRIHDEAALRTLARALR